jgi:hypothetical protein
MNWKTFAILSSLAGLTISCSGESNETTERVSPPEPEDSLQGKKYNIVTLTFTDTEETQIASKYQSLVDGKWKFQFDDSLEAFQTTMAKSDLLEIATRQFSLETAASKEVFQAAFGRAADDRAANGEQGASGVLDYLQERVKVFVGKSIQDRPTASKEEGTQLTLTAQDDSAFLTAQNSGTLLWYINKIVGTPREFVSNGKAYRANSTRAGIISLLPGYNNAAQLPNGNVYRLANASTLVHEARHSDCTAPLTEEGLQRIRDSGTNITNMDFTAGEILCGHLHVVCPEGSDVAGKNACDNHRFGPYEMGGLYNQMVAQTCVNCSEEELALAEMSALSAYERVLVPRNRTDLPNMKHVEPSL